MNKYYNDAKSFVIGGLISALVFSVWVTTTGMSWVPSTAGGGGGLPLNGPLGDGRHGAVSISVGTTATEVIYALTDLTVSSTWQVKQQNPGGIIIAVTGTFSMTSTGIIDADGTGGLGGTSQTTAATAGKAGAPGKAFAGRGGNGGGDGTRAGGPAAPVFNEIRGELYKVGSGTTSGYNTVDGDEPWSPSDAATMMRLQSGSGLAWLGAVAVGTGAGAAGAAWSTNDFPFDVGFLFGPSTVIGYGSGAGSGGNLTGNSGAGGAGGGFIFIVANTCDIDAGAQIRARGAAGSAGAAVTSGGGGGGGGGSLNGQLSGAGGNGGRGEIWVIEFLG